MVLLSWAWGSRPSCKDSAKKAAGEFNYEHGHATAEPQTLLEDQEQLSREGYSINYHRVSIGHGGRKEFLKAKQLLQSWRHFQLDWAFVPPETSIQPGEAFCVSSREFVTWLTNPLQIRYIQDEDKDPKKCVYAYGSGTLRGHLLAGEERFAVEWDKDDGSIWYEVLSFSKPVHPLSLATYPYVKFKQRVFARESGDKMVQEMGFERSTPVSATSERAI